MQFPAVTDTIVAVSSAWAPATLGVVRLSGPEAFALAGQAGAGAPPARLPARTAARVVAHGDLSLPAGVLWFAAPRSYTGQDVVELHTTGCLPVLRDLCSRLIRAGARRALPGEFTGRAVLNGRLNAQQAGAVLELMRAGHEAEARSGLRSARLSRATELASVSDRISAVLARVEAGIDFVDEEDVRFITAGELQLELSGIARSLSELAAEHASTRDRPHVALVGLPNAGKSTLFNALVGSERALVSPVLGTTRDVISAELEIGGVRCVLQDTAGLCGSVAELEQAARRAAESAAGVADVVIWVHAADQAWTAGEAEAVARIPPERRILVYSKNELGNEIPEGAWVRVSAFERSGLDALRSGVARLLQTTGAGRWRGAELEAAFVAINAAFATCSGSSATSMPELVTLELRVARERLAAAGSAPTAEEILGRIYSQFCVGK